MCNKSLVPDEYGYYKKASIRSQDSVRCQFQAGLRGDVGL